MYFSGFLHLFMFSVSSPGASCRPLVEKLWLYISNEAWLCSSPDIHFKADFGLSFRIHLATFSDLLASFSRTMKAQHEMQSPNNVLARRKLSITCSYNLLKMPLFSSKCLLRPHRMQMTELAVIVRLLLWLSGFPANATVSCCGLSSSLLYFFTAWTRRRNRKEEVLGNLVFLEMRCEKILSVKTLWCLWSYCKKQKDLNVEWYSLNSLKVSGGKCWSQITFKKLFSGDMWDAL